MLRQSELPLLPQLPELDDDSPLSDESPEWVIPELRATLRDIEGEDDELGFRSLFDRREDLSRTWRTSGGERASFRGRRAKRRRRARMRPPIA